MTTGVEEPGQPTGAGGAWWFWEVEPEWADEEAIDTGTADIADFVGPDATPFDAEDDELRRPPVRRGRTVLGLAVLATERLRARPPTGPFLTGVGLLQLGAAEAGEMVRRAMGPSRRVVARGAELASRLPGATASRRSLARSRERLGRVLDDARRRGEVTVAAGRAEASALVRSTMAEGLAWAQEQALPQLVDGLVPHLVDDVMPRVMPRLIDGALPEIRSRVVPAVVDELTNTGEVQEALRHHARGVIDETLAHLHRGADNHLESAVRRLVRSPHPERDGSEEPIPADEDMPMNAEQHDHRHG